MINSTVCLLNVDRKTLFLHRNKDGDMHYTYHVPPRGRTERRERGIDCIMREFKEETGLTLINPKLKVIATFYNQGRILGRKENPEDWIVEIYKATRYRGKLKEEHTEAKLKWISDSDILSLRIYPCDMRILDLCKKRGII